jgi:4-diphosphocytidyl-2-C-methyl-D-erythritol kinase
MRRVKVDSLAKVNLYLEVKSKRNNGYHNIETVFQRINLHDTILLEKTNQKNIQITCNHPLVPIDKTNLAYKAAELLFLEAGIEMGLNIHINKIIPVAAGLGGGSSNAATVMKAVNKLCNLGFTKAKLLKLGTKLGADVPFFLLEESCALGCGIGDVLKPVKNVPTYWYVIIYPKIHIRSKWAYDHFKLSLTKKKPGATIFIRALKSANLEEIAPVLYNDLASVVGASYKGVQSAEKALRNAGVKGVLLSGSGPCVFGICKTKGEAEAVRKRASSIMGGTSIFICRSV